MDIHDKAHYGIAGFIAAGTVAGITLVYHAIPADGPRWPSLDAATADAIVVAVAGAIEKHEFEVDCIDKECTKISNALVAAGKREKIVVKYDHLISGADNLSVGAPTKEEAANVKTAIESASHGALKVSAVISPYPTAYIAFGVLGE